MEDKIFNVIVPKEKRIKVKAGKRHSTEEKIYPGYVLVEMILAEDSWYDIVSSHYSAQMRGMHWQSIPSR